MKKQTLWNHALIRQSNLHLIAAAVKAYGPISRAELSRRLSLTPPAISNNIEQLLKSGMLQEVGVGESSGGRKPTMLAFNNTYRYLLAVSVSGGKIHIAVGNLDPWVLAEAEYEPDDAEAKPEIVRRFVSEVRALLDGAGIALQDLPLAVIGSPGVFDREGKIIQIAPIHINMSDPEILNPIKEQLQIEIIIRNNLDLDALGEHHFGAGRDWDSMSYLHFDNGVGAGIIIGGKLYRGSRHSAGEIRNMCTAVGQGNEPSSLEDMASIGRVVRDAKELLRQYPGSPLNRLERIKFADIADGYLHGDPLCVLCVERLAGYVVFAIVNVYSVLASDLIVLGGRITLLGAKFLHLIQSKLREHMDLLPEVALSQNASPSGLWGALGLGVDRTMDFTLE